MARQTKNKGTLKSQLEEYTTTPIVYWVLYNKKLFAQEMGFEEFSKKYLGGVDKETADNYQLREDYQEAVKELNNIMRLKNQNELHDILLNKAQSGDINAIKAYQEFAKDYFGSAESELSKLMNGLDIGDGE